LWQKAVDNYTKVADDRFMKHNCGNQEIVERDLSLRIPLTAKEQDRFRAYLKRTDKKAGAFARTAILAAMAKDDEK
jgi:hypothetical protein